MLDVHLPWWDDIVFRPTKDLSLFRLKIKKKKKWSKAILELSATPKICLVKYGRGLLILFNF